MKLSKVLSSKGRIGKIFTISSEATLSEAAKIFSDNHIGALLVKDKDSFLGIITEKDIIRICSYESEFYKITVSEVMTVDVIYADINTHIRDAMRIMGKNSIRHLPVKDGDEIVGVVSIGDILEELYEEDEVALRDVGDLGGAMNRNNVF
jgi:CBS domain-containing protein